MELLCIETHPEGVVKAGETYLLVSDKSPCSCIVIDVGVRPKNIKPMTICSSCRDRYKSDGVHWIFASRFAVIATDEEVKQAEQKLEPVNKILRKETFVGQTVMLEEMKNGNYTVTSFGELGFKKIPYKSIERAAQEYGCIKLNITKHYMGAEQYGSEE